MGRLKKRVGRCHKRGSLVRELGEKDGVLP
jgi:hypothetical protein